jgi:hypothetical protein
MVAKVYQRRSATGHAPSSLFGDMESGEETVISHNTVD